MKIVTCMIALVVALACVRAEAAAPVKPTPKDKCPVCGMFVAKYPDFTTRLQYRDGAVVFFDGSKDLFKYLLNLKKYAPGKSEISIQEITVADYYSLAQINARTAWFVVGSDVYGPMGKELIAFGKEADAQEFRKDHKGKKILRYRDVIQKTVDELDG